MVEGVSDKVRQAGRGRESLSRGGVEGRWGVFQASKQASDEPCAEASNAFVAVESIRLEPVRTSAGQRKGVDDV